MAANGCVELRCIGNCAVQSFLLVAAFLDGVLHAELRDGLGRFLIAGPSLLNAPPATDGLFELAEAGERVGSAAIDRQIFRRDVEGPAKHVHLAFVAAGVFVGVGHGEERGDVPGVRLQGVAGGLEGVAPLAFADGLVERHPRGRLLEGGQLGALLAVVVFLGQVRQEMLQVDQVDRIVDQALRVEVVGVLVIAFLGRFLGVVEHGLQPLAHGGRQRRQDGVRSFRWLLSRHGPRERLPNGSTLYCVMADHKH